MTSRIKGRVARVKHFSFLLSAFSFLLASCDQEDLPPAVTEVGDVVEVTATIGNTENTRVAQPQDNTYLFESGDEIHIVGWYGSESREEALATFENPATEGTYLWWNEAVSIFSGTKWQTAPYMRWQNVYTDADGKAASPHHHFLAWWPEGLATGNSDLTAVPVITTGDIVNDDILCAQWSGQCPSSKTIDLAFNHLMARFDLRLSFANQNQYLDVTDIVAKAKIVTSGVLDLLGFSCTPAESTAWQTFTPVTFSSSYDWSATTICVPQEGSNLQIVLSFKAEGEQKELTYTHSGNISLSSNERTTLVLKVGKEIVELVDITVTDWETAPAISGGEAEEVKETTSQLTTSTVASESLSGAGTADDPYLIQSAADLLYLSQKTDLITTSNGLYYRLTTDIEVASDVTWAPINSFRGTFDGNGKTISGTLATSGSFYGSVFGSLFGTVKNLNVSATITVSNTGNLHVGGIVSHLQSASIVEGCTFSGTITKMVGNAGWNTHVGGIAGMSNGTIKNCINTGTVNGPDAGYEIDYEYNMMTLYVSPYVGGIAGYVNFETSIVYGCTHSGSVVKGNDCSNATANSKLYTGSIVGMNANNGIVCSCNTATTDTDMAKVGSGSISETCSHTTAE